MTNEDKQARFLTCIGEPTRLQILKLLANGEKYVGEIVDELGGVQSLISYHLRHLRECNIVLPRQDAQRTYYRLADNRIAELVITSEAIVESLLVCQIDEDFAETKEQRYMGKGGRQNSRQHQRTSSSS